VTTVEPGGDDVAGETRLDLPLDAHLHTDRSPDADVPIDLYCAVAERRGVAEIAITDHVDFEPGAPAYGFATFADRERSIREAAERWAGRVAIRFGIEVTYQVRHEAAIRDHLRRHPYDYAIGSVHVMTDSPYVAGRVAGFVAGRSLAEVVEPYFAEVAAAARSGLFDTIGHLDFVKRYLVPHVTPADLAAAPELYEPVLRAIVEAGSALEMNTSGLRQAAAETYPAAWAVERYRALGGQRVSVGSDAHRLESFGFGLADGYAILAAAGFEELAFRRGGAPVAVAMPARPAPQRP
jgi:histidinol-phosphatase (PHP family)